MAGKFTTETALLYARQGSLEFNARMQQWLSALAGEVRAVLGENLVALVLGGGYGRGEGGVLRVADEEKPYNDLDFTLVVHQKAAVPADALEAVRHRYERLIGIAVDFSRPLTLNEVRAWPFTLMWSDLLHGHAVLEGPADVLTANAPPMPSNRLPAIEATRLLLNRGAGLLWSMRVVRGAEPEPDADFVRRNYFKCALALGDALLISYGRFATPYSGRDRLLAELLPQCRPSLSFDLARLYDAALAFKFWPGNAGSLGPQAGLAAGEPDLQSLAAQWGEVWLHIENRRTGAAWPDLSAYVRDRRLREPAQSALRHWPRNLIRNGQCGFWSVRYPREALYRQLPVLLGLTQLPDSRGSDMSVCVYNGDATVRERSAELFLRGQTTSWAESSERFLTVWKRVN
jgi:hypothetical protein